jgi:hypothetical protein
MSADRFLLVSHLGVGEHTWHLTVAPLGAVSEILEV